ncbi:hypothetical protein V4F39_17300 [Aquincola sp. MAHUQ-54]|uniref:Uncharacterized protein n=1 Tax=Aquincola agrisoli TaxID=3119538 RepID=A0AAW9QEQ7_9BURK
MRSGTWPYWSACLLAVAVWLACGPLQAAPSHGTGPVPAASAPARPASAASAAGDPWVQAQRRCAAHTVRAVREECLAQARRELGPAAAPPPAAPARAAGGR